jgi:cytokinin dehydrogenase
LILEELHYISGFGFSFDQQLFNFLNRVYYQELELTPRGLWLGPHPWLDLFLPKSKVLEFDSKVMKGIFKGNNAFGTVLFFPMYKAL